MKRIAILHPFFEVSGGAERKLLLIGEEFKDQYDLTFICFRQNRNKCFPDLLKQFSPQAIGYGTHALAKIRALFRMAKAAKNHDLILASNFPSNLAAAVSRLKYKTPVVWFCNEPILHLDSEKKRRNPVSLKVLQWIERRLVKALDHTVANSFHTARFIEKKLGLSPSILYDGVDENFYRPPVDESVDPTCLFFISRIEEHKNVDLLLDVMEKIIPTNRDCYLSIGGTGPYLEHIKMQANARALNSHICFLGQISEDEKVKWYHRSAVFLFPALREPLGIVPIEAALCGVPTVAFNSGGCRETVR
ncbi:MAG: glycosyltransferase family 4 protein, partial [Syntrophaceae bacterium]|nr:glycosyltransferase family 4 protein [Syntrophaceae bacterium]